MIINIHETTKLIISCCLVNASFKGKCLIRHGTSTWHFSMALCSWNRMIQPQVSSYQHLVKGVKCQTKKDLKKEVT